MENRKGMRLVLQAIDENGNFVDLEARDVKVHWTEDSPVILGEMEKLTGPRAMESIVKAICDSVQQDFNTNCTLGGMLQSALKKMLSASGSPLTVRP